MNTNKEQLQQLIRSEVARASRKRLFIEIAVVIVIASASITASSMMNTKFGIGEVAPVAKFEVKGDGATSATINANFKNSANTSIMYIRDDGRVGIGTVNPGHPLYVKTPTNTYGMVHGDGIIELGTFLGGATTGGYLGTITNHPLSFFTNNGAAQVTILQSGNVGIGTVTPASKLEVNGTIHSTLGGIKFPDNSVQTKAALIKKYDSGWFACTQGTSYIKAHGLGTTSLVAQLYWASTVTGTGMRVVTPDNSPTEATSGGLISNITTTTITAQSAIHHCNFNLNATGNVLRTANGFYRIIAYAL